MNTQSAVDLDLLRVAVAGDVITPDDRAWDAARAAWNLLADQRPALIVTPLDAADVAETVRYARSRGLRVIAQGTGHGATTLGPLDGVVLIRTGRMDQVTVDPTAWTAWVLAGARWSDVIAAAAPHGLACLHGYAPGVGVAGYVLGGGLGWLARRYGLACGYVASFEVVTADGDLLRVDAKQHADLFWALRGGGGAGVIVTAVELQLVELRSAYAGALLWPIDRAAEIAHAYRDWTRGVPDTLTSSLRLLQFPPAPELPAELRGRALVQLTLTHLGGAGEGRRLVAPLRALMPEIDRLGEVPVAALGEIAGDPVDPMPAMSHSRLLAELTPEIVDAFVALSCPELTVLELRHLGGALAHPGAPGAAGRLTADALVFASGVPVTPEHERALRGAFAAIDSLGTAADRGTLLTFAERGDEVGRALPAATLERVRAVAAAYDPYGICGA